MRAYFLERKTWEEICVEQNIGYRRLMYIRNDVLDAMFGPVEKVEKLPEGRAASGGLDKKNC